MLHIVQSNRLDTLADALLERWPAAGDAPAPPEPPVIIVPSRGIERWLSHRIADRLGVCADVQFRFAAAFLWSAFGKALPDVQERSPFDSDVTALRLFGLLESLPPSPVHAPLARYLADGDALRRLELARRIAQVFAQYMVYRPEWLERWAAGQPCDLAPAETERWQQALWRELLGTMGAVNVQHPRREFHEVLARRGPAGILPPRVSVFALPEIAPLYADLLAALGRHVEVDWYHLNPCAELWTDIRPARVQLQLALEGRVEQLPEVGNSLLASWGGQRRGQLRLLAQHLGEDRVTSSEPFVRPGADTVLGRLQAAMLDLAELADGAAQPAPGDSSVQIHQCHSLTRQVEVLHDQLLTLFTRRPDLGPGDVCVLVPDVDAAAPVIESVFGSAPPSRRIPFAIGGQCRADGTPLLQACEFLLSLPQSRFELSAVLAFVEIPAVMRRYELDVAGVDVLRRWLRDAGARWALDAAQRAQLGVPAESRHTWCESLYRLLAGYAMPSGTGEPVLGVLPHGEIEGSQARTLGKLARLLGDLARAAQELSRPRPLADWPGTIERQLRTLLKPLPDDLRDDERLRRVLGDLAEDAAAAGARGETGVDVLRALLRARLQGAAPGAVPTGRVTFTHPGPLRGLPYRVIALLGMDGDAFPRSTPRLEFDLAARAPRAGDRMRRDEDRGAFLDALAGAGDVLWIGYTARSIRDDAELPPSVLVAELCDALARAHPDGQAGVRRDFVTAHRLQAFHPDYFRAGSPRSHDAGLLEAARALSQPLAARIELRPLFPDAAPPPAPGEDDRDVTLDDLLWFYRNPASQLLKRHGIRLPKARDEVDGEEPFELDDDGLKDRLLALRLAGVSAADCVARTLGDPAVPHGAWGREQLRALVADVDAFAGRVESARGDTLPPQPFALRLGPFRLRGTLAGHTAGGLVAWRMQHKKKSVHAQFDGWLHHLVLCALAPEGVACSTRIVLEDGEVAFAPVPDAGVLLEDLVQHRWRGLHSVLPYFPRSAWAWACSKNDPMHDALAQWRGGFQQDGERERPSYRTALGGLAHDLPAGFEECAQAILGPMQRALAGPGPKPAAPGPSPATAAVPPKKRRARA